jgi:hypothetical protein
MAGLGWKSVGVLELTALPSIEPDRWMRWVREADVLLANGGDALFLAHWMRQAGDGRPAAVGGRDGLGRVQRWEHGHDPPHWR